MMLFRVKAMAKERPPIEEMTLRQLRKVAAEYEISRYSRMRKSQLLKAIQSAKLGDLVGQHEQKTEEERQTVEAKKFELGQPTGVGVAEATELAMVDWNLGDLPDGYDEARIVLLPRDPQWLMLTGTFPIGIRRLAAVKVVNNSP